MSTPGPLRYLARVGVVATVIVVIALLGGSRHHLVDLTAENTLTLSPQTLAVLDSVESDIDITAFVRTDDPTRVDAATVLDRYRKRTRHIEWDLADPDDAPGEVRRLGVDPVLGGVVLRSGDHTEIAPSALEHDLTAAIARLVRGGDDVACVTTGHGEPQLTDAAEMLERDGYRVRVVDLLAAPTVPEACTVVILAAPTSPLGDAADTLARWVDDDGKLLVLTDPRSDVDLTPLLDPWGMTVLRGAVFEGDPDSVIGGDVTAPIIRTFSVAHPVAQRLAPLYLPGTQAIEIDAAAEDRVDGLTLSRLADSSELSYLETDPLQPEFDPADDTPGPLTVVAAADRSRVGGGVVGRTRLVVVGDADFASGAFLGEGANAALLLRAVGWLAEGADVAAISPNLPSDRPLRLTSGQLTYARFLTIGTVPGFFLLAGLLVWLFRRGR